MKISGKKNKDGKYDPNTIYISFTNNDVNTLLAEYLSYKDQYKKPKMNPENFSQSFDCIIPIEESM